MVAIKNFAVGTVAVGGAPSPATSGTSLTLTTGHGARFLQPSTDGPFYASAFPPGVLPSFANAEIVQVTARSTDTITIVRAQRGSTAQSIGAGWVISNSIFTEDLFTSSINVPEVLSGTPNGVLTTFTLSQAYTMLWLFKNGVFMRPGSGNDYTLSGTTVTFATAPATGTLLLAIGITGSQLMISGSNSQMPLEVPTGLINSSNTLYTVTKGSYVGGSLFVWVNGVLQRPGVDYVETNPGLGTFTFSEAPLTGQSVLETSQWASSVTGNADTVDGFHAASTPTANMVPVLDASALLPRANVQTSLIGYAEVTTTQGSINSTETDLTGLSVAVTAPGGRDLKITAFSWPSSTAAGDTVRLFIKEGSTYLGSHTVGLYTSSIGYSQHFSIRVPAPSAGSHTYKLSMQRITGSGTISSNAGTPSASNQVAYILVEVM